MAFRHRDALRRWMFDAALPWWAEHGLDRRYGGYIEQVTLEGEDAHAAFKRTRVTARQIYVFSHAAVLGWSQGKDLARHGVAFLVDQTWGGPDKGFARRLSRTGGPLDPTPDLYDIAFTIFGFAWFYKATSDKEAYDWLHRTLDFVETHMRHPQLGFWHELTDGGPPQGWRQQNPHMHLTEAMLAAYDATSETRFSAIACELAGLFQNRFFDAGSGTLAEYFNDDFSRAPGAVGELVEPGHQLEWAWILNQCRERFGLELGATMRAAAGFAERCGIDPSTGAVFNAVRRDGEPVDKGSRTWPNTERLKAAVALFELDGKDPLPVFEATSTLLLGRYLGREPQGTWIDAFDGEGRPTVQTVPASTLYHVFLAFAEVLRLSDSGRLG